MLFGAEKRGYGSESVHDRFRASAAQNFPLSVRDRVLELENHLKLNASTGENVNGRARLRRCAKACSYLNPPNQKPLRLLCGARYRCQGVLHHADAKRKDALVDPRVHRRRAHEPLPIPIAD